MRFKFTPSGDHGLPVIPVVPDHKLSTIEGRNGIGKTLAARILEFITDGQPFAALPMAWESFARDLGKLTVTIDGFPGGQVVRCELDGAAWEGLQESQCVSNPGSAFINDRPVAWADVHHLIKVRRIAGDEGLTETLARTLRESSLIARRRDDETSSTVYGFGEALQPLTDDLIHVRAAGHAEDASEYARLTRELAEASSRVEAAKEEHGALFEALERHEVVLRSVRKLPGLLTEYAHAIDAHETAEKASNAADAVLTEIGRRQEVDAKKAERIEWLLKRRPYRLDQLAKARVDEQRAHERLGVLQSLTSVEIRARIREIDEQLKSLEEENKSADLAGTVRNVQTTLLQELRGLPSRAQNEKIATIGRDIRVRELADGIAARRKQLEGIPKPNEVAHREDLMAQLRIDRMWLSGLPDLYRKTRAKQKLVDDGEAELAQLRGDAGAGDELDQANQASATARGSLMQAALAVSEARAGINAALGLEQPEDAQGSVGSVDPDAEEVEDEQLPPPSSVAEVEAQVQAWLDAAKGGIDPRFQSRWTKALSGQGPLATRVEQAQGVVEEAVVTLQKDHDEAGRRLHEASSRASGLSVTQGHATEVMANRLERLGAALRGLWEPLGPWAEYHDALEQVARKCDLTWTAFAELAERPPVLSDVLHGGPRADAITKATRVVESVAQIAGELETAAARVRDQWSNAANYLHKFSADLSSRLEGSKYDAKSMRASAGEVLTKWAEDTISDLLSSPELRTELFDQSPVVTFNIKDHTVSWTERTTKRRRRRPLEAFSSGEQVFAYTKAKLERLANLRDTTDNVVIFLDEFGAFVARDRFAQLVTYIQHDALGRIADQIVVTVPLSGDLDQIRDNAALASVEADVFDPPGYVVIPARAD